VRPSPGVSWIVETTGVTLLYRDGVRLSIPYPSAALWALVANGNYEKGFATELVSILRTTGRREAEEDVEQTLAGWIRAGLVTAD